MRYKWQWTFYYRYQVDHKSSYSQGTRIILLLSLGGHEHDWDFCFCQRCGSPPALSPDRPGVGRRPIGINPLQERLISRLDSAHLSSSYVKRKSALFTELETFLADIPLPKSLLGASPRELCLFLIWKDRSGKTRVHLHDCVFFGLPQVSVLLPHPSGGRHR